MPARGGYVIPQCPTGYIAFARGCGHHQAAAVRCKSILCVSCEKERATRIQARWLPTLETLPLLKFVTLTIPSGHDLAERLELLTQSFRRLLEFRCGRNTRKKIIKAVAVSVAKSVATGTLTQAKADDANRAAKKWCDDLARMEKIEGKSFKVRRLLRGLSSLEVTHRTAGWHPHRHLIVSTRYLPLSVLLVLWFWATKGAGKIAHIRKITNPKDGLREVVKYTVKPWEIPEDKQAELLSAMHRKKRLWVIGRIKPQPEERQPCPGCDSKECNCHLVATVSDANAIIKNALYVASVSDGAGYKPFTFSLSRDTKGHLTWSAVLIRGESDLSLYPHSESRIWPTDEWAITNHDPPT